MKSHQTLNQVKLHQEMNLNLSQNLNLRKRPRN